MGLFEQPDVEKLLKDLDDKMNEIGKVHGVSFSRGTAVYGEDISFKITFNKMEEGEHGVFPSTVESREFLKRCKDFHLMPDILFQEFDSKEGKIRIMGYSTRKRKYPIIYTKNGRRFKCSVRYMVDLVKNSVLEYMI